MNFLTIASYDSNLNNPLPLDWRLVAILGSLATSLFAITTAIYAPHTGYIRLLYLFVPKATWACFLIGLVTGILLLYKGATGNSKAWRAGIIILAGSYLVFWFMPTFGGLQFWTPPRGDMLGHFGDTKTILATGQSPAENMYPGLHFILASIVSVSGIRIGLLQPIVSATYYSTFIVGIYIFVRRMFDPRVAKFTMVAATPLAYGRYPHTIMPWFASFSLIPLILFLAESDRTNAFKSRIKAAPGIVIMVGIVVIHPMTSMVIAGLLASWWGLIRCVDWSQGTRTQLPPAEWGVIMTLPFVEWYLDTAGFTMKLKAMVLAIIMSKPGATSKAGDAAGTSYTMAQLVWRYLIIEWGAGLLFIGLGGLAALYLVLCIIRRKGSHHELVALSFYGIGLGLAIVMLAFGLIVSDPIRMNQVTLFASILLIGATLARLSQNTTGLQRYLHALGRYALVIALVVAAIGAPFTVYNESKHVRETEMAGAEHLIRFRNPDKHTLAMAMSRQLGVFVMGTHRAPPFPNWVFSREKEGYQLPSRLGYETNSSVSALFEKSGYIVTKERDRKWIQNQPPNRWPGVSYLTAGDLRRLNNDLAADHVYSNGRYSTWLVHKPMQNMTQ